MNIKHLPVCGDQSLFELSGVPELAVIIYTVRKQSVYHYAYHDNDFAHYDYYSLKAKRRIVDAELYEQQEKLWVDNVMSYLELDDDYSRLLLQKMFMGFMCNKISAPENI